MKIISFSKSTCKNAIFIFSAIAYFFFLNNNAPAELKKELRLIVPLYSEDAELTPSYVTQLSQYMTNDDIFAIRANPKTMKVLKEIKKGKIAVIRQSLAALEKDINFLNAEGIKFHYICYNPEGHATSHTEKWEKENTIEAVKKVYSLAQKHKVGLIIVPDTMGLLPKYGPQMAQYADIFAIQFQRFQLLPQKEFRGKVLELINIIKKNNPSIPIIAQISINPPSGWQKGKGKILKPEAAEDIIAKINAIKDIVDGVGFLIFSEGDGLERFKQVIQKIKNV